LVYKIQYKKLCFLRRNVRRADICR